METLQTIIDTGDPREIKRSIAVRLFLLGVAIKIITETLGVSAKFVSKWRLIYERAGAEALLLQYSGSESYLETEEREEVINFISGHYTISLETLIEHIETQYGVIYKSKQSYYDLLTAGRMSWHKTQKSNPKRDAKLIADKREEIKKN